MINVETVSVKKKFAFCAFMEGLFAATILAVSPFPRVKNKMLNAIKSLCCIGLVPNFSFSC